ncbi:hypothetical protein FQN57_000169 [Myotisia sp. PD_48]|nr:hypothetical protein FQN57_000169 [Myotisia sp. PD_48]
MSTQIKPIKVWGDIGPNPWKIVIVMKELGLQYEMVSVAFSDVKKPEYVAINPNGRLPAIYDPNTDVTLWESGAIVEYLVERYDPQHKLSFSAGTPDAWHARQWLHFQATGQGPYYGQMVWFKKYHPEQLPSAVERYVKEINRVTGVLEASLKQQKEKHGDNLGDGPWLVGNKLSYADLAFIPWQYYANTTLTKEEGFDEDSYPHVKDWYARMTSREASLSVLPARS